MKSLKLGEVSKYIRGITFKPDDVVEPGEEGSVVCMRTKNIQVNLDEADLIAVNSRFVKRNEQYLQEGDLLVSSANSWNLVGKTCYVPKLPYKATAGGFISVVRPNRDQVEPRYLYHWLSSNKVQHYVRLCGQQTTNISNLDRERFLKLRIPLPPLEEQRRIAAILDKADGVRRKRREAIRLTEELLRSAFLEMFGDPVSNPKGWAIHDLGSLLHDVESGWSPKCDSRAATLEEWGVLKLGSVTYGHFNPHENKAMLPENSPRPELEVKEGDLLVTRKNTYELVGASAFVHTTRPKLMLPDLIFRLQLRDAVDPVYVWQALSHPSMRYELSGLAGGTAGSMPNISKARLRTLPLPVPPRELQLKYRQLVNRFWIKKDHQNKSHRSLDALFNSLLQRAFRGEL